MHMHANACKSMHEFQCPTQNNFSPPLPQRPWNDPTVVVVILVGIFFGRGHSDRDHFWIWLRPPGVSGGRWRPTVAENGRFSVVVNMLVQKNVTILDRSVFFVLDALHRVSAGRIENILLKSSN